jgi:hypothetical protein
MDIPDSLKIDKKKFDQDPFGYSAIALQKFGMVSSLSGVFVDITKPATSGDLKNPVLWLTQAHALTEAAITIIKNEPSFDRMPVLMRGVCHSQYCAVGLMLVGYSLETTLKAMKIMEGGIKNYQESESKNKHHRLHKLADFIPDLTEKEIAILQGLTHFVYWAGRYPDPGAGKEDHAKEIFQLSEKYKISANDLFKLAEKVTSYAEQLSKNYLQARV